MKSAPIRLLATGLVLTILLAPCRALADRTVLKPAKNSYTPQQDVALGQKAAREEEKKLPMCNAPEVDAYLTKLGHKLIDHLDTGGVVYPWEFHCVNDKAINAFALPGGFVFVNRGAIEVADYEAELAGVMAHELSHVALRHGTSQLTKAQTGQVLGGIASVLGGILGGGVGAAVGAAGQLGVGSVLLKYSRGAETQADVMGTQVLYDAGYDPRALAAFFEKISAAGNGQNPPTFLSDHPSPDNRTERVQEEISKLGGVPEGAKRDSAELENIKRQVMALPVVKRSETGVAPGQNSGGAQAPAPGAVKVGPPSQNYLGLQTDAYTLKYPDNWKKYGNGSDITVAPDGGIVDSGNGQAALAYGMAANVAQMQGQPPANGDQLGAATQKLIETLQHENANMKVIREGKPVMLNGERGLSTYLENDSPAGGKETDWLVTVMRPEGLVYFVCVAPRDEYRNFDKAFGAILDSVRFAH